MTLDQLYCDSQHFMLFTSLFPSMLLIFTVLFLLKGHLHGFHMVLKNLELSLCTLQANLVIMLSKCWWSPCHHILGFIIKDKINGLPHASISHLPLSCLVSIAGFVGLPLLLDDTLLYTVADLCHWPPCFGSMYGSSYATTSNVGPASGEPSKVL